MCRQTQPGWLFLSINILKATIVHFSRDFIRHLQRLNKQSGGKEKEKRVEQGREDERKGTEWGEEWKSVRERKKTKRKSVTKRKVKEIKEGQETSRRSKAKEADTEKEDDAGNGNQNTCNSKNVSWTWLKRKENSQGWRQLKTEGEEGGRWT